LGHVYETSFIQGLKKYKEEINLAMLFFQIVVGPDHETPEYLGLTQLAGAPKIEKFEQSDLGGNSRGESTEVVAARPWTSAPGSSSERVRELLSQGMMMLNISSLAERISSTPPSSSQGEMSHKQILNKF
jgi:hypothetical protein